MVDVVEKLVLLLILLVLIIRQSVIGLRHLVISVTSPEIILFVGVNPYADFGVSITL